MIRILYSILCLCVLTTAMALSSTEAETPQIMTKDLQDNGVAMFLQNAHRKEWKPPRIPLLSIDEEGRSASGTEPARDFGSAALRAIDDIARQHAPKDSERAYAAIQELIDFASWLKQGKGFWNLMLVCRIADVACVRIGYLAADSNSDMRKARILLDKVESLVADSSSVARVLNEETGETLFDETWSIVQVRDAWRDYEARQIGNAIATNAYLCVEERNLLAEELKKQTDSVGNKTLRPVFFEAVETSGPLTTSACWGKQCLKLLVLRYQPASLKSVDALLEFRERVGGYPVMPKARIFTNIEEGEEAFREAWMPYRRIAGRTTYSLAWATYKKIQDGSFTDIDAALVAEKGMKALK